MSDFIEMTDKELQLFTKMVYEVSRVSMDTTKRTMLSSRIHKRMRELKIGTYLDYLHFLKTDQGQKEEMPFFLDSVTTHKTDFFRENHHFDFIKNNILPHENKTIHCWSAASSSGEEIYSLAMILHEFYNGNSSKFTLLASDISQGVLEKARKAIYSQVECSGISDTYSKKYMLKGKDHLNGYYRVVPEIRQNVKFIQLNLNTETHLIDQKFKIIFLRNVMIYFDQATRQHVISQIENKLEPGGWLFLGHAESLIDIKTCLVKQESTVYQKPYSN